jgi:hypothetical protein
LEDCRKYRSHPGGSRGGKEISHAAVASPSLVEYRPLSSLGVRLPNAHRGSGIEWERGREVLCGGHEGVVVRLVKYVSRRLRLPVVTGIKRGVC